MKHESSGELPDRTMYAGREMNIPLLITTVYLLLGMVATGMLWFQMEPEIEMALDLEENEMGEGMRGSMRLMLTLLFVLFWPMVVYDLMVRK